MKRIIIEFILIGLVGCSIGIHDSHGAMNLKSTCTKYLKSMLKDPNSYESITWYVERLDRYYYNYILKGKIYVAKDSTYIAYELINQYRAKNSFGGYNIESIHFLMDSVGNIQFERSDDSLNWHPLN